MFCLPAWARAKLEENILRDGCREPLTVWKSGKQLLLIDGHNRYEICIRNNVSYQIVELEFEHREAVLRWIDHNIDVARQSRCGVHNQRYRSGDHVRNATLRQALSGYRKDFQLLIHATPGLQYTNGARVSAAVKFHHEVPRTRTPYFQLRSCLEIGNVRTRFPVAA